MSSTFFQKLSKEKQSTNQLWIQVNSVRYHEFDILLYQITDTFKPAQTLSKIRINIHQKFLPPSQ